MNLDYNEIFFNALIEIIPPLIQGLMRFIILMVIPGLLGWLLFRSKSGYYLVQFWPSCNINYWSFF